MADIIFHLVDKSKSTDGIWFDYFCGPHFLQLYHRHTYEESKVTCDKCLRILKLKLFL